MYVESSQGFFNDWNGALDSTVETVEAEGLPEMLPEDLAADFAVDVPIESIELPDDEAVVLFDPEEATGLPTALPRDMENGMQESAGVIAKTGEGTEPVKAVTRLMVPLAISSLAYLGGAVVAGWNVYQGRVKRGLLMGSGIGAAGAAIPAIVSSTGPDIVEGTGTKHMWWMLVPAYAIGAPLVGGILGALARGIRSAAQ